MIDTPPNLDGMSYCELAHLGAETIMNMRNMGQPLDVMLRDFKAGDMQAVIIRAYGLPKGLVDPVDFADAEMVRCLNK